MGAVSRRRVACGSPRVVCSRLPEVPGQGTIEEWIVEVVKLENHEERLLDVNTERDSFSIPLKHTKKRLREGEDDFVNVAVDKKALVEQVIKKDTEIGSLRAEVKGAAQDVI